MDYEIQKTLVLSTGHIPEEESLMLEVLSSEYSPDIYDLSVYQHGKYGWNIYVGKDFPEREGMENIFRLLRLARKLDCGWLRLDCDGPTHDNLPKFEW